MIGVDHCGKSRFFVGWWESGQVAQHHPSAPVGGAAFVIANIERIRLRDWNREGGMLQHELGRSRGRWDGVGEVRIGLTQDFGTAATCDAAGRNDSIHVLPAAVVQARNKDFSFEVPAAPSGQSSRGCYRVPGGAGNFILQQSLGAGRLYRQRGHFVDNPASSRGRELLLRTIEDHGRCSIEHAVLIDVLLRGVLGLDCNAHPLVGDGIGRLSIGLVARNQRGCPTSREFPQILAIEIRR